MDNRINFEKYSFSHRLKSMMKVDLSRMLKSKLVYIMVAVSLLVPIVMTVMLTMMDGQESKNPQTGEITVMEGPESVWESIGTIPEVAPTPSVEGTDSDAMAAMGDMDVMAMCNVNMAFMGVCVFVCLFISDDFRSGYAKNLFTRRAKKGDYVFSKTVMGIIVGALMLIAYFIGAMLGGAVSGLSFELTGGINPVNILMCMIAKIFLMAVFVSIFTLISLGAKHRAWLSITGSLGGGMLLFMMVSMITPLNSTVLNVILCLAGGALFSVGLGIAGKTVLEKTSLV